MNETATVAEMRQGGKGVSSSCPRGWVNFPLRQDFFSHVMPVAYHALGDRGAVSRAIVTPWSAERL